MNFGDLSRYKSKKLQSALSRLPFRWGIHYLRPSVIMASRIFGAGLYTHTPVFKSSTPSFACHRVPKKDVRHNYA